MSTVQVITIHGDSIIRASHVQQYWTIMMKYIAVAHIEINTAAPTVSHPLCNYYFVLAKLVSKIARSKNLIRFGLSGHQDKYLE